MDRDGWIRSRYEAALQALQGRNIGASEDVRRAAAASMVAHWAYETGWGGGEWHYNLGNVHCSTGWTGDCSTVQGGNGPESLRVYPDLAAGVSAYLDTVSHYPEAWARLALGDLSYWGSLQQNHYGGHETADNALSIQDRVARTVGISLADEAERTDTRTHWGTPGNGTPTHDGGHSGSNGASDGSTSSNGVLLGAVVVAGGAKLLGWW